MLKTKKIFLVSLIIFFWHALLAKDFRMLSAYGISGLIPDVEDGYGISFRDFNQDGYPDIYLVCFRNLNRLLINNGGIVPFIDRTIYSGLGGNLMPRGQANLELGASAADYDNDGLADIFLAGWGKSHTLFHNDGDLNFTDVTEKLNMNSPLDANQGLWIDADNDGYLDLYITDEHHPNRLLMNQKNGAFAEVPWSEGFRDTAVSQGASNSDFDGDGDQDIYVCNWFLPDYLLINDGRGRFARVLLDLSTLTKKISTNSAAWGDTDNDGDNDLYVAGRNGKVYIYINDSKPDRPFFKEKKSLLPGDSSESVYGILLNDFNQDGWLDCFLSVKGGNRLYLNDGTGSFAQDCDTDANRTYSTGAAAADLDHDGDLDIFVANKDALSQVYLNPVNNKNFIQIRLRGSQSNRDAFGSKLFFYHDQDTLQSFIGYREISGSAGYLSSSEPVVHFGTGDVPRVGVKIFFPSGKTVEKKGLIPGKTYTISEHHLFVGYLYSLRRGAGFLFRQPVFWLNLALVLALIVLVFFFTRIGLKRYRWSPVEMTVLFLLWFIFTLIVLLALRNYSMTTSILAVNGVAFSAILVVAAYSEYNLRLRRKRYRFRRLLQNFSERMIGIHGNKELFRQLIETCIEHEEITKVRLFKFNKEDKYFADVNQPDEHIKISQQILNKLPRKNIYYTHKAEVPAEMFPDSELNVFIPVRRNDAFYAMIGLAMENVRSPMNQEDLRLLPPLANQLSIAVENNEYIEKTARLVKQLTEAEVREEYLKQLEEKNRLLDKKNMELTRLFKELQEKEVQLVHSEKMASLGRLVAGISHELNNPVSFIYANSKALANDLKELRSLWRETVVPSDSILQQRFDRLIVDFENIIQDNLQGSKSVKELVLDLRNFSRLDQAEWKEASIVQGLEDSLKIMRAQIPATVKVVKDFRADPKINCNPGQLNQVFVNLISNALQAVGEKGRIDICTSKQKNAFVIEVKDNGVGIPENHLPKIFEPFFTTKEMNKGTGLGLSISYSIVQKHGGSLTVQSQEGRGSIFTIRLPLKKAFDSIES